MGLTVSPDQQGGRRSAYLAILQAVAICPRLDGIRHAGVHDYAEFNLAGEVIHSCSDSTQLRVLLREVDDGRDFRPTPSPTPRQGCGPQQTPGCEDAGS